MNFRSGWKTPIDGVGFTWEKSAYTYLTDEGRKNMPKVKLMENDDVKELVTKRVAQVEAAAAKNAQRTYKALVRTMKEALGSANLDKKVVKGLTEHLVSAVSAHAPGASQAAE